MRQGSPKPRIENLETHSRSQVNLNQNHTTPWPIVRVGKRSGEEMCANGIKQDGGVLTLGLKPPFQLLWTQTCLGKLSRLRLAHSSPADGGCEAGLGWSKT